MTNPQTLRRGTLMSYAAGTATVRLAGSLSTTIDILKADNIADGEMLSGRNVAVAMFDDSNPGDAVLFAVWD